MIKDALAYIVGMRKPEIVQIGDEHGYNPVEEQAR